MIPTTTLSLLLLKMIRMEFLTAISVQFNSWLVWKTGRLTRVTQRHLRARVCWEQVPCRNCDSFRSRRVAWRPDHDIVRRWVHLHRSQQKYLPPDHWSPSPCCCWRPLQIQEGPWFGDTEWRPTPYITHQVGIPWRRDTSSGTTQDIFREYIGKGIRSRHQWFVKQRQERVIRRQKKEPNSKATDKATMVCEKID